MDLERGQDDQISGLLDLIAALVDVQNPGRDLSAAVPEDFRQAFVRTVLVRLTHTPPGVVSVCE